MINLVVLVIALTITHFIDHGEWLWRKGILTVQPFLNTTHLPKSLDAFSVAKNKMI
jgi:hypothetical protein